MRRGGGARGVPGFATRVAARRRLAHNPPREGSRGPVGLSPRPVSLSRRIDEACELSCVREAVSLISKG